MPYKLLQAFGKYSVCDAEPIVKKALIPFTTFEKATRVCSIFNQKESNPGEAIRLHRYCTK